MADTIDNMKEGGDDALKTLSSETGTGKHVPSVVFMELEPSVGRSWCGRLPPALSPGKTGNDRPLHCVFMVDNDALCGLCRGALDTEGWTYTNLSGLMGRVISSLTASLRFDGSLNVDFTAFHANDVRDARIQCAICSLCAADEDRDGVPRALSVTEIDKALIAPAKVNEVPPAARQVHAAGPRRYRPEGHWRGVWMIKNKTTIKFIDCCPVDFKICISHQPPAIVPGGDLAAMQRAVRMVTNATAIAEAWNRLDNKLELTDVKRAFVHWDVGEGMKEAN
jgi:tubulin alpha